MQQGKLILPDYRISPPIIKQIMPGKMNFFPGEAKEENKFGLTSEPPTPRLRRAKPKLATQKLEERSEIVAVFACEVYPRKADNAKTAHFLIQTCGLPYSRLRRLAETRRRGAPYTFDSKILRA